MQKMAPRERIIVLRGISSSETVGWIGKPTIDPIRNGTEWMSDSRIRFCAVFVCRDSGSDLIILFGHAVLTRRQGKTII